MRTQEELKYAAEKVLEEGDAMLVEVGYVIHRS
jgi:hypothetical protein